MAQSSEPAEVVSLPQVSNADKWSPVPRSSDESPVTHRRALNIGALRHR